VESNSFINVPIVWNLTTWGWGELVALAMIPSPVQKEVSMARVWWTDPSGNSGHGDWLPVALALLVAEAYRAEVPGRTATVERGHVGQTAA